MNPLRPMVAIKALHSAQATIAGIDTVHMIGRGQIANNDCATFQLFAELVG